MKKIQKQEMLETVQTLHQAHEEIKINIERKNFMFAQDMLSQCQECAVSIGNAIEKLEGEGFVTVPFIESYCDILFSVFEELKGTDANANKIYKNLKKQLLRIENSIKNDVPIRKEIAFFPYKASMWDSLESIYLKLKQEDDCDVYCVPIPYYDRNPDGSLGQMHYEGREYPKNIEVIDWQTYKFEDRKPDAIYIHNPYDDWNLVTCVHPRFFSANLKKNTEELIYIPYFVLDEIEPDDQMTIDKMKHFIWTPGVINADKVIVQSEKMKHIYVNEYLKAAQANRLTGIHTDRKYLEEKIQGLGSPKLEKIKNTKKEDLEIPDEWLKIIEKPDGSRKKIVFYNTSIAALLENNEKMLEKMKDVFALFKRNKDEVALLWRPHPLIKNTVASMRPQLWTEYEKIVNQYRQEGWGIYDDTSDMDRAVIMSDAYYGDASSVVQVYQQTGKPVMVQNVEVENKNNQRNLLIEDAILYENNLWFYSIQLNHLLAMDMLTNEVTFCEKIPTMRTDKIRLFASMKRVGKKIYFIPFNERKIVVFDIENKKFSDINLPDKIFETQNQGPIFMGVELYHKKIYIFPALCNVIISLNTENEEMEYITEWVSQVEQYVFDFRDAYFRRQVVQIDNKMYAPFCNANAVLELNCDTNQTVIHKLGSDKIGYSGICFNGKEFWLSSRKDGKIIQWNLTSKDVITIEEKQDSKETYLGILCNANKIYCISNKNKKEIAVDDKEKIMEEKGTYFFAKEDADILYFYKTDTGKLTMINKKENKESKVQLTADDTYVNQYMFHAMKERWITEFEEMKLNHLVEELVKA